MKIYNIIECSNNDFAHRKVLTKIVEKNEYSTFEEYLET